MEPGARSDSGHNISSSEPSMKLDKPPFKIKIPFQKNSGKQQTAGSDTNTNTMEEGMTSNIDTSMIYDSSDNKNHVDKFHPQGSSLMPPNSDDLVKEEGIQNVESSQQSMSSTKDDSILIDSRSANDNKKAEVHHHSRTRSSSFDLRDDIRSSNHATSTDDKQNRPPLTNNHTNHAHEYILESNSSMNRQINAGSNDSKEVRETVTHTSTSSFLDALNEDERRVRTRHLPAVAGFHRLHKKEVHNDLSTVKNLIKTMAPNTLKSKRVVSDEAGQKHGDKMDVDEVDNMAASDEDNSSETSGAAVKGVSKATNIMDDSRMDHIASSFSIPYPVSNYVLTELDELLASTSEYRHLLLRSPQAVESLTTFNPPRPPESVGPKKNHRLIRWEKNPNDIEKDLMNYKKTVRRTKEELQKTIRERECLETVGCLFRTLFMDHLNGMRIESEYLAQEMNQLQSDAYRLIDGDTRMKTRHKSSTSKGNGVMNDVISFISSHRKTNSVSLKESEMDDRFGMAFTSGSCLPQHWLVRGDKVSTPYGEGTVVKVFGPHLQKEKPTIFSLAMGMGSDAVINAYPARVCVRLSYGIAYVSPLIVKSLEHVSAYTNDRLAFRWTAMLESASEFSSISDPNFNPLHVVKLQLDHDSAKAQSSNARVGSKNTFELDHGIQTGLLVNHPIESLVRVFEKILNSDRCILAQVRFHLFIFDLFSA